MDWEQEADVWESFNEAVYGRLRLDLIKYRLATRAIGPGSRVLDVGTGTGELAVHLALRGAEVTAIDRSPAMLARARRLADTSDVRVHWIESDATSVAEFGLGRFDLVLSHNVLAYIENGPEHVKTLGQLPSPGGRLSVAISNAVSEPLRYALEQHDLLEAERWVREQPRTRHGRTFDHPMRFQTRAQLAEWIQEAGLAVEEISGLNVIAPYLANEFKETHYDDLLRLEIALGDHSVYAEVAVHLHAWAVMP